MQEQLSKNKFMCMEEMANAVHAELDASNAGPPPMVTTQTT